VSPSPPDSADGEATDSLAAEAGRLARERGWTVAVAESCTGGLVGHRLTSVSGSSAIFLGGIIAYSNEAKVRLLGVRESDLQSHGAVSEPAARQMAEGACRALGADVGIGVTGIMGPDGGSLEKPVGLVYISGVTPERAEVRRFVRGEGDRAGRTRSSSEEALRLLVDLLRR
jgi:PncC family amidohydrolase